MDCDAAARAQHDRRLEHELCEYVSARSNVMKVQLPTARPAQTLQARQVRGSTSSER